MTPRWRQSNEDSSSGDREPADRWDQHGRPAAGVRMMKMMTMKIKIMEEQRKPDRQHKATSENVPWLSSHDARHNRGPAPLRGLRPIRDVPVSMGTRSRDGQSQRVRRKVKLAAVKVVTQVWCRCFVHSRFLCFVVT